MTLFEYIKSLVPEGKVLSVNEQGRAVFNMEDMYKLWEEDKLDIHTSGVLDYIWKTFDFEVETKESEVYIASTEHTKLMKSITVIEDPSVKGYEATHKYPYYRLRGKPITAAQAIEIVRRTDSGFTYDNIKSVTQSEDTILSLNFINHWVRTKDDIKYAYGWVHPDGTIGVNNITTKYPNWEEFLREALNLIMAFPYLDFVVALTFWDNFPEYVWEHIDKSREYKEKVDSDYPDFLDCIDYGIWVHDRTIEFMEPTRARAKYQEYVALYGAADTSKYITGYYEDKVCDLEAFLEKCNQQMENRHDTS